jgi:ATP-dependent Clp protease ATP-binding subunit ClpC
VDFKNTVVIMTSNVGSAELRRVGRLGFLTARNAEEAAERTAELRKGQTLEGLRRAFRPEFLNRVDQVVVFRSLSREDLGRIVELMLAEVSGRLRAQGIALEVSAEAQSFLIADGYNEEFGARPLRRAIQTHVDDALADAILAGTLQPGSTVRLGAADGRLQMTVSEADVSPA